MLQLDPHCPSAPHHTPTVLVLFKLHTVDVVPRSKNFIYLLILRQGFARVAFVGQAGFEFARSSCFSPACAAVPGCLWFYFSITAYVWAVCACVYACLHVGVHMCVSGCMWTPKVDARCSPWLL